MDEQRLKRIAMRLEAARRGPLRVGHSLLDEDEKLVMICEEGEGAIIFDGTGWPVADCSADGNGRANAEFIAASFVDVPDLLAHVATLTLELKTARERLTVADVAADMIIEGDVKYSGPMVLVTVFELWIAERDARRKAAK